MKNKGFTLIELIVVITILAILGTIAFIGFKGYTSDARDSKVTTDIANLHNSLAILKASKGVVPMPDSTKIVTAGITKITYEGEVGDTVKNTLKASSDMKTPAGDNYKYAVSEDQKDFTLVGLLENETASLGTTAFADSDATVKYFKGGDVLTLFDANSNFKEGDVLALADGDVVYTGEEKGILNGSSLVLESCKQIKDYNPTATDGVYKIASNGEVKDLYCDMTTDGGGWTLVYKINGESDMKDVNEVNKETLKLNDNAGVGKLSDEAIRKIYGSQYRVTMSGYSSMYCTFDDIYEYSDDKKVNKHCGTTYLQNGNYVSWYDVDQIWRYGFSSRGRPGSSILQLNYVDERLGAHRVRGGPWTDLYCSKKATTNGLDRYGCSSKVWVK